MVKSQPLAMVVAKPATDFVFFAAIDFDRHAGFSGAAVMWSVGYTGCLAVVHDSYIAIF